MCWHAHELPRLLGFPKVASELKPKVGIEFVVAAGIVAAFVVAVGFVAAFVGTEACQMRQQAVAEVGEP